MLYDRIFKNIEKSIFKKYKVKLYKSDCNTYDIINNFLEENQCEKAFYLIDLGEITKSFINWITLIPYVKPFYKVKCNTNRVLIEVLALMGSNFECESEEEIKLIIDVTKDPTRIIFAYQCKMTSHISYACMNDVNLMTFNCEKELYKIKLHHPYTKLILRLEVDDNKSICKFNSVIGCKLDKVDELLTITKTLKLDVIGFSFHIGSGCLSTDSFYDAIRQCREATNIAKKKDIIISIIDIGGGFPCVYKDIKFEDIAQEVNRGINDFFGEELKDKSIQFISKPGRFFSQKTHTLVLNIIGKKIINDKDEDTIVYYLNDGIYNLFNCIFFTYSKPILLPFNERDGKLYKSKIICTTCNLKDIISKEILLQELTIGEWVFFENFGAYQVSSVSSSFNDIHKPLNKYIYRL
jgi:ornithine decarboxylase